MYEACFGIIVMQLPSTYEDMTDHHSYTHNLISRL